MCKPKKNENLKAWLWAITIFAIMIMLVLIEGVIKSG